MSDDLPDKMPPRPGHKSDCYYTGQGEHPNRTCYGAIITPTTKVPKVFGIWGTACYGVSSISSIIVLLIMAFTGKIPPWWFIMSVLLYTFVSAGFICMGRIESNRDARFFIHALRNRSDENKRRMN